MKINCEQFIKILFCSLFSYIYHFFWNCLSTSVIWYIMVIIFVCGFGYDSVFPKLHHYRKIRFLHALMVHLTYTIFTSDILPSPRQPILHIIQHQTYLFLRAVVFYCTSKLNIYSWKSRYLFHYANILYSRHDLHQQTWKQSYSCLFSPAYFEVRFLLCICRSQTSHTIWTSCHTIWADQSQTLFLTFCDLLGILSHANIFQGVPCVVVLGVVITKTLTV